MGIFSLGLMKAYPDKIKLAMWIALGIACLSLFLSSFATEVWHLILLQGVCFGVSAGAMYFPVIMYLSQWFQAKRGLAGGM